MTLEEIEFLQAESWDLISTITELIGGNILLFFYIAAVLVAYRALMWLVHRLLYI